MCAAYAGMQAAMGSPEKKAKIMVAVNKSCTKFHTALAVVEGDVMDSLTQLYDEFEGEIKSTFSLLNFDTAASGTPFEDEDLKAAVTKDSVREQDAEQDGKYKLCVAICTIVRPEYAKHLICMKAVDSFRIGFSKLVLVVSDQMSAEPPKALKNLTDVVDAKQESDAALMPFRTLVHTFDEVAGQMHSISEKLVKVRKEHAQGVGEEDH